MKKNFIIYTDGSHLKHTSGRLGIGGVLIDPITNKKIAAFSKEISVDYMIKNYGTSDVSNPTCEMLANLWALREFASEIGPEDEICMKADYIGVQAWNTKVWKINKPYIQKIKEDTDAEIKRQRLLGRIKYDWVKGHQKKSVMTKDAYWNNYVDKLAKGEVV